jgi:uncharacterized protein DUF3822
LKTAIKGYKLLKKIKDKEFDVDNLHQYNLHILSGNRDLQFTVSDTVSGNCLLLEDYAFSRVKTYKELVSIIKELYDNHHLLKAGFWNSVKVGIKNNKFSLVPSKLFDPASLFDYLKLNCKINPETDQLLYYKHLKSDAVNCFAINKYLYNFFQAAYPKIKIGYVHQSSTLIEGVLAQLSNYPDDAIFLYVDRFKLHVISSRNKKLEYYNQFSIKQFEDYVKYIMLVFNGLKRSQQITNVIMWGYIGKQSTHYHEFIKYIKHVSFGERPKFYKYGFVFDELQDHYYFDAYNLQLCE